MTERSHVSDAVKRGDFVKAEEGFLRWMDKYPGDLEAVGGYADRMFQKGNHGLALHLYKYLLNVWHEMPAEYPPIMWSAIGTCLKFEGFVQEAEFAFNKALEFDPKCHAAYNGIAMGYADEAKPEKAIEFFDKGLAVEPNQPQIMWNRGVAYLQLRRWKEGWEGFKGGERRLERSYHQDKKTQEWDEKRNRCVVVWGEQGVGDEIMFGTCLPDIIRDCREVILDCHPRLEKTFQRSFPGLTIYPTRKTNKMLWPFQHKIDRQISIGNLPGLYRNNDKDFPGTPYLKTDPERVKHHRGMLERLGKGPYVAITWFGGEKKTRFDYRSIPLKLWQPLRDVGGTFVSIQYNKWGHRKEAKECGIPEWPGYYDPTGPIEDLDEMFALIEASDLVISVCQTAIHMAGSIGKECWCLVPNKPSWRYLIEGEQMPWYNSVRLIRQGENESWESVIARVSVQYRAWKEARNRLAEGASVRTDGQGGVGSVVLEPSSAVA